MHSVNGLAEGVYSTKFARWETRSAVRSKPRRQLAEEAEQGKVYFPPRLVPVSQHPLVRERGNGIVRRVLIQRLHAYLDFTAELEQGAVNPVAQVISRRRCGFDLPERMIEDAYKICTDESWHAQFSDDLQRQIIASTGVAPSLPAMPSFFRRLHELRESLDPEERHLALMFFTIVSETLISAILSDIPHDEQVVTAVRELVADHAEDEGRHHAYFSAFLQYVWPRLTNKQQRAIGPLLPEFVLAFLEPDVPAIAAGLRDCDLSAEQTEQVLAETYSHAAVVADIRKAARPTLRHLARIDVYEEPRTREAFERTGLLLPDLAEEVA